MSPEQAQGHDLDLRTDLFSLGSVLYVMSCGRPPFRAATSFAVLKRVVEDQPRPVQSIIPEVPAWLAAIIARLHAKNPAERFATADELSALLARCLTEFEQCGQVQLPADIPPPAPEPTAGTEVPPSAERISAGPDRVRHGKWVPAAMLILLATGLGMSDATGVTDVRGTVVRLFSPKATLTIEIDDPRVRVSIDGEEMLIDSAGVHAIRVQPGPHSVLAARGGEVVHRELVTVTPNGRSVVHIGKPAQPATAPNIAATPTHPTELPASEIAVPESVVDRKAAEFVLSLGGKVRIEDQSQDISDPELLPQAPFRLTFIDLRGNRRLTPSSFAVFRETKNLTGIRLDNASHVSDAALANFQNNQRLKCLGTWGAKVSAAGLEPFRDCPALHSMFLGYSPFDDDDMAFFATFPALPKLTALFLTNCPVTDDGLRHLRGAEKLMQLHLDGTRVTDAGLQQLTNFSRLSWLSLERTAVGDAGLTHLQSCPELKTLSLLNTNVTAQGIADLQRAIPKCKITWDGSLSGPSTEPGRR